MDAAFLQSLLPADAGARITDVAIDRAVVEVRLATTADAASCPRCQSASTTVHGRYHRTLQDRPCLGLPVRLLVTARKFVCRTTDCPRRVFCERLPELTHPHAHTTGELADAHRHIGLALGGEAGSRLATELGLPTSADTILRRVKDAPDEPRPRPRYVGIDDWATRKGQSYGTILIDLERGTVIDLLPGRDGEALKAWLASNPQVEVITRDRWPAYIQAATTAAPQAKQVADRFHLLRNVREAVEKILSRVGSEVRTANADVNNPTPHAPNGPTTEPPILPASPSSAVEPTVATPTPEPEGNPTTATTRRRVEKQQEREERFRQVKELLAEGVSCREVARRLGLDRKVVLEYRRRDRCPDWSPGRPTVTALDPFAAFIAAWVAAGKRNSADLYRELKGKGYAGGYDAVRRYLSRSIGSSGRPGRRDASTPPPRRKAPSARRLAFRVVNPKEDSHSTRVLKHLRQRNAGVHAAVEAAEELMAMIRQEKATTLSAWAAKVVALGDPDLRNLADSLLSDAAAVQAAMTEPWSNGQVEGQVGRLKGIKRQMYGRAGMKLLRARVRHKG
jgi:transposase